MGSRHSSIVPVPVPPAQPAPAPAAGTTTPGGTAVTAPPVPSILSLVPTAVNSRSPSAEEWELRDGRLGGAIYSWG